MLKNRLLISLAVLSCLLFNASLSHDCLAGFYDKHSANDVKSLMVKANAGDRIAQEELAGVYQSGEGIAKSEDQAVIWYKKAALQGCASSQRFLGYHYLLIAKDYKNAFYWFEKSARAGDKVAQCRLGGMYLNGEGIPKNYKMARIWTEKASNQGEVMATFVLAKIYREGLGVPKNNTLAYFYWDQAGSKGNVSAKELVATSYLEEGCFVNFLKSFYWLLMSMGIFNLNEPQNGFLQTALPPTCI